MDKEINYVYKIYDKVKKEYCSVSFMNRSGLYPTKSGAKCAINHINVLEKCNYEIHEYKLGEFEVVK